MVLLFALRSWCFVTRRGILRYEVPTNRDAKNALGFVALRSPDESERIEHAGACCVTKLGLRNEEEYFVPTKNKA